MFMDTSGFCQNPTVKKMKKKGNKNEKKSIKNEKIKE